MKQNCISLQSKKWECESTNQRPLTRIKRRTGREDWERKREMGFDRSTNDHRTQRGNNTSEQPKIAYADSTQERWMHTGSPAQTVSFQFLYLLICLSNVFLPPLDLGGPPNLGPRKWNPLTINTNFFELDFKYFKIIFFHIFP